jgi:hypothetical protein
MVDMAASNHTHEELARQLGKTEEELKALRARLEGIQHPQPHQEAQLFGPGGSCLSEMQSNLDINPSSSPLLDPKIEDSALELEYIPLSPTFRTEEEMPWVRMLSVIKDTPSRKPETCKLCGRPTHAITKHHWFPRRFQRSADLTPEQRKAVVFFCWPCHCILHRLIPHNILGEHYLSVESLARHGGIKSWLRWAKTRSIAELHGLMIPIKPKSRTHFEHLLPAIEEALDKIWAEQNFPEGIKGRVRAAATALRNLVAEMVGSRDVQRPEIRAVMLRRPEWQAWYQQVFLSE